MSKREYPFKAWVLGGTFIPKQIEFIRQAGLSGDIWHRAEGGKFYKDSEIFDTKNDAIKYGMSRLEDQKSKLERQSEGIKKKLANLEKALARGES